MPEPHRIRGRALGALAAVVAVALAVGGILAVGAYAAARMAGLTDTTGGHSVTARGVAAAPTRAPSRPASQPTDSADAHAHAAQPQSDAAQPTPQRSPQQPDRHAQPAGHAQQRHAQHRHAQQRHPRAQRAHQHRRRHQSTGGTLTLHAQRTRVRPMGRIDLGGRCGCRSGSRLMVQRLEHGHWARFPASATAYRGRFHTWVMTGRRGANEFRVVLPGGGASNPVTITVS